MKRKLTIRLARESYNEAAGDLVEAESIFRSKAQRMGIDPATVLVMLKLAYEVWKLLKELGFLSVAPDDVGSDLGMGEGYDDE